MTYKLAISSDSPSTWDYTVEDEHGDPLCLADGSEASWEVTAEQEDEAYSLAVEDARDRFGVEVE